MPERQLDLFADGGLPPAEPARDGSRPATATPHPRDLDDCALIAGIPRAGLADAAALADEAARRGLAAAVPALEELCRRFAGFGRERAVPEQVAALQALGRIGGPDAARAVVRLVARDAVAGPGRKVALEVAARLGAILPAGAILPLLRDPDPDLCAAACRCTGPWPAAVPVLLDLAREGDVRLGAAALCALGRMGRQEARPGLVGLLRDAPSAEIIEAVATIADEDCVVLLGRTARTRPALAHAVIEALATIDHPRARQLAGTIRAVR
ncbi:MAG TPA: HEAT repeat domain-containing protein [Geminicoccaceae bacterium]